MAERFHVPRNLLSLNSTTVEFKCDVINPNLTYYNGPSYDEVWISKFNS